jgi:hypothetical protein
MRSIRSASAAAPRRGADSSARSAWSQRPSAIAFAKSALGVRDLGIEGTCGHQLDKALCPGRQHAGAAHLARFMR